MNREIIVCVILILVMVKTILCGTTTAPNNCNDSGVTCKISQRNIKVDNNNTASEYDYDTTITYKCKEEFQFPNLAHHETDAVIHKVSRCGSGGNWVPPILDCVALCPRIHTWRGFIVDKPDRMQDVTIRYTCWGKYAWYLSNAGKYQYKFKNGNAGDDTEYSSVCSENGTWIPQIEDCIEVKKNTASEFSIFGGLLVFVLTLNMI